MNLPSKFRLLLCNINILLLSVYIFCSRCSLYFSILLFLYSTITYCHRRLRNDKIFYHTAVSWEVGLKLSSVSNQNKAQKHQRHNQCLKYILRALMAELMWGWSHNHRRTILQYRRFSSLFLCCWEEKAGRIS